MKLQYCISVLCYAYFYGSFAFEYGCTWNSNVNKAAYQATIRSFTLSIMNIRMQFSTMNWPSTFLHIVELYDAASRAICCLQRGSVLCICLKMKNFCLGVLYLILSSAYCNRIYFSMFIVGHADIAG
jgi:hypothetical protein